MLSTQHRYRYLYHCRSGGLVSASGDTYSSFDKAIAEPRMIGSPQLIGSPYRDQAAIRASASADQSQRPEWSRWTCLHFATFARARSPTWAGGEQHVNLIVRRQAGILLESRLSSTLHSRPTVASHVYSLGRQVIYYHIEESDG